MRRLGLRALGSPHTQKVLHASDDYYGGSWYDAIMANHVRQQTGGARRTAAEMSQAEEGDEAEVCCPAGLFLRYSFW